MDYLKYDNCNNGDLKPLERYPEMSKALMKAGHPIYFSICEWYHNSTCLAILVMLKA